ncbi:efflux RND transporter permease subunit [Methylocystis sp. MJC1]|uniref:efflux RND transporter permease subunit n=1 Tax=Methylocystis sp. MJC1 TaxID=2654282 RepID=UPI0013ED0007|nr:efflux RND transporter permease subunit [Methylocystis sp. MJC1]KAF2989889.1 Cobalt-zinc-cadmium resistance protein CzcA [Methylocystis sp. MJC1]MBU6528342.1 efflux RND transporter permease subunit [Methylocystis sp. MJC1]UZX11247.1 efflux RND transporter permease subunit [Methylocystis sp. MJC1]
MLKSVLEFGLTRRAIIVIGVITFAIAGLVAFSKLNIEAYPNPAPVIIEISAQSPGLSAEEMEKYFTIPIEIGLYSTPGVVNIRSTSFYGLTFVRVTFRYGVDYYAAKTQVAVNLQQNVNLPNNITPQIQQSSLTGEIYRYQIKAPPNFGLTNIRTIQDWVIARRLLTIPGIVQVTSWGGTTKQFDVDVDLRKLEAFNVTIPQVVTAIGNSNVNVGGREIQIGQQSINIRGIGLIDDGGAQDLTAGYRTEDIENIVLSQTNGVPVRVRDVAEVSVGFVPRLGVAGRDYEDDITAAIVLMGRTQHTHDMLPKVKEEIEKINADGTLPPGVRIDPYYDRGALVDVTTHTVLHNLYFGMILVFLIQWIFLGDLRSALIVAVNIPFALFFAIIVLVVQGEDANLLSVGAVDFGIIVDSAVILVENVFRNFQASRAKRAELLQLLAEGFWGPNATSPTETSGIAQLWTDRLRLIFVSALQVDKAVFFTATITIIAFLPLFTMTGVEGQIFGPMARTYAYALIGALLATFTVTPVLASIVLPDHVEEVETLMVRWLRSAYTPALRFSLTHPKTALAGGGVFLFLAALIAMRLGSEFLPTLEEGNLWIRASLPPTTSLAAGESATGKMREILLRHPEVVTVVSQHGRPDNGSDASPFSNVELFAPLKPFDEWPSGLTKEKLTETLEKEFEDALPGVGFNFSQYIQDNIQEALSGVKGANSIKIVGPDLNVLEALAEQTMKVVAEVPGVEDLAVFHLLGQPNLNIVVDRAKSARYGLTAGDVNTVIQSAVAGAVATSVLEGDRQFPVLVRLAPQYRNSIDAITNVKVAYANPNGPNAYVPLKEVAAISLDTGASFIYRERGQRYVPIKFSIRGRDLGSTVADAQARVAKAIKLPMGYQILWAGEFDNLQEAKKRLLVVVPVTLALVFLLLYALFNSFRESLLAFGGIPFAMGGGVIALYVSGLNFSVSAAIGFISLFGVAVMDGILNITYIRELTIQGMEFSEAVFYGAEQRMRPMLMTALSAGVGLFPAAVSHGIGSQVQRPLATVVVGGMFFGPVLILIVAPALRKLFLRGYSRASLTGGSEGA